MTHTFNIADYNNSFLPSSVYSNFRTMDGRDVALWLTGNGYTVTGNKDTGRNGLASTKCGYSVSTNGYVCLTNELTKQD